MLGAGFTVRKDFPLYLEGTAAHSRYDPTYLVSDGTYSREVPVIFSHRNSSAISAARWVSTGYRGQYKFGDNVQGGSAGIACSF